MRKIKTITSHAGLARWLAQVSESPVGTLSHEIVAHIPSPYAYSPEVYLWDWNGRTVFWRETRHKHYEIYAVD